MLSKKLTILLAIASPKRVSELARFDVRFMTMTPEYVTFRLPGLSKTLKNCTSKEVTYHAISDKDLCVVECRSVYLQATKSYRGVQNSSKNDPLLRTVVKPHKGLSANTVANRIKQIMSLSGIDTDKFQAHSTRGASTSKASNKGISISEILNMADWSNATTFRTFYCKPVIDKGSYQNAVLSISKCSSVKL